MNQNQDLDKTKYGKKFKQLIEDTQAKNIKKNLWGREAYDSITKSWFESRYGPSFK